MKPMPPMSAAIAYTSSTPATASRHASHRRRSCTWNSSAEVSVYSGLLVSTPRTQKPRSLSDATRWLPMKPPAPVTSARMSPATSVSPPQPEHSRDGQQQDLQVGAQADAANVGNVEVRPLVHRLAVAACVHLPGAGQSRLHRMTLVLPRRKAVDDAGKLGPRPDEADLGADDVAEVGKLVEAPPAQDPAEPRQARIVLALVTHAAVLAGAGEVLTATVSRHRAELVDSEQAATLADAHLPEDDRTAEACRHSDRDDQHERGGWNKQERCPDPVDDGFDQVRIATGGELEWSGDPLVVTRRHPHCRRWLGVQQRSLNVVAD